MDKGGADWMMRVDTRSSEDKLKILWNVIATHLPSAYAFRSFVPLSATHVTACVPRASDEDGEVLHAPKMVYLTSSSLHERC